MKDRLTAEQSARLIELGVDPSKASGFECLDPYGLDDAIPTGVPLYTLSDLLKLLPKEIIADTIMGKDWPCAFVMRWDENRHLWVTAYETLPRPLDVGNAPDLIDCLYALLILCIKEKFVKL